jgi:hypothetical protein
MSSLPLDEVTGAVTISQLIPDRQSDDGFTVRFLFALILATGAMSGESYPKAWNYVAPDATAIVGFDWQHLQDSFLGDAVFSELSSAGHLGVPDLDCLKASRQILLSAPDLLAIFSGSFPAAAVDEQAVKLGLHRSSYNGVRIWMAPEKNRRSVAQVSETLLLVGWRDTLEGAIDRGMQTSLRPYSPLLARGARLAPNGDFWITANGLPDPLVTVFLPIGLDTGDFDGVVNVRNGLRIDARYSMSSTEDALLSAQYFREAAQNFHAVLQGIHVIAEGESVLLKLDVSAGELEQYLNPPPPPVSEAPPPRAEPAGPKVVRILGLDDGPREHTLPEPGK